MASFQPVIERFPDELLDHILDYLTNDTGRLLAVDQRASLSVESFATGPAHSQQDVNYTNKYVCLPSLFGLLVQCPHS
jgi:hypothetical protein